MPHTYGLYPWSWNAGESCHEPPEGAFAVLDLRPLSQQAVAGQSSGWGFFAWPDNIPGDGANVAAPSDVISLGYGDCRELQPTTAQRDELRIRLGLSSNPSGATLIDTIGDCLGSLSDPTGQNGPKPLLPTREGTIEIHLSNHSRVLSRVFDGVELFSASPKGHANRIRDVLRNDLETAFNAGGQELAAKVLGDLCQRWGVDFAQAVKWRGLIKPQLLAKLLEKGGGSWKPKKPQTSYSDDFNDGDVAGWTSVTGTWSNSGTAFRANSGSIDPSARFESDLSAADHWSDITQLGGSTADTRVGPAVRFAAAANTHYGAGYTTTLLRVIKMIAGARTNLSSASNSTRHTARVQVNGSGLTYFVNGVSTATATDTAITGNTRCGARSTAGNSAELADNWSCDDGITAATPSRLLLLGVG